MAVGPDLFVDLFDRTAANIAALGNGWHAIASPSTASADGADLTFVNNGSFGRLGTPTTVTLPTDYGIEVIAPRTVWGGSYTGIFGRVNASNASGIKFFAVGVDDWYIGNTDSWNGENVALTTVSGLPSGWTNAGDHTVRLEFSGSRVDVYADGQHVGYRAGIASWANSSLTGTEIGVCGDTGGGSRIYRSIRAYTLVSGTTIDVTDPVGLIDSRGIVLSQDRTDTVGLVDTQTRSVTLNRSDPMGLVDSVSRGATLDWSDTVGLVDTQTRSVTLNRSDPMGLVDSASRGVTLNRSDPMGLVDSVSRGATLDWSDPVGLVDSASRGVALDRSDPMGLVDSVSRGAALDWSDPVGLVDSATWSESGDGGGSTTAGGYPRVRDASSWPLKVAKTREGAVWVPRPMKVWDAESESWIMA